MNYISNLTRAEGDPKILRTGRSSLGPVDQLGRALGWLGIGLGVMELAIPHRIARALGAEGSEGLLRAFGGREIASGILTLSTEKGPGLWMRVAGDALDIAMLMRVFGGRRLSKRTNVEMAMAMVLGVTLLDFVAAQGFSARHRRTPGDGRSYSDRSGFPQGVESARGSLSNYKAPQRNHNANKGAPQNVGTEQ
ncbi:MAG: hypothetical protein JWM91_4101 [Rhodospirillales bacterium]|nr:hypothetical protein [Rhodospirillales bacterium]